MVGAGKGRTVSGLCRHAIVTVMVGVASGFLEAYVAEAGVQGERHWCSHGSQRGSYHGGGGARVPEFG